MAGIDPLRTLTRERYGHAMDNDAWDKISAKLELVVTEASEPFDEETIANGREFLTLARGLCAAPDDFGKGYWSIFRFTWSEVEVEVFGGHLETYRGEEIAHFDRHPGQLFPLDFIDRLPKA